MCAPQIVQYDTLENGSRIHEKQHSYLVLAFIAYKNNSSQLTSVIKIYQLNFGI